MLSKGCYSKRKELWQGQAIRHSPPLQQPINTASWGFPSSLHAHLNDACPTSMGTRKRVGDSLLGRQSDSSGNSEIHQDFAEPRVEWKPLLQAKCVEIEISWAPLKHCSTLQRDKCHMLFSSSSVNPGFCIDSYTHTQLHRAWKQDHLGKVNRNWLEGVGGGKSR